MPRIVLEKPLVVIEKSARILIMAEDYSSVMQSTTITVRIPLRLRIELEIMGTICQYLSVMLVSITRSFLIKNYFKTKFQISWATVRHFQSCFRRIIGCKAEINTR